MQWVENRQIILEKHVDFSQKISHWRQILLGKHVDFSQKISRWRQILLGKHVDFLTQNVQKSEQNVKFY